MDELKTNRETEKPIDNLPSKAEISKIEADEILEKRLVKGLPNIDVKDDSSDKTDDANTDDASTSCEPNSKYFKDGRTYETDDNGNVYKIDGKLLINSTYEVNGYRYITDDNGRTIKIEGQLKLEPGGRDMNAQKKAGGEDRQPGDQGGHLIAKRFGGSGGIENLVAMKSELNQGDYKKLENDLAKAFADGKTVTVSIDVKYDTDSQRPTSITVKYTIDGETSKKTFIN